MNFVDIIIILILAAYCGYVLYNHFKKSDDCTHVCSSCSATSCHLTDYTKEINRIRKENQNG